MEWIKIDKDNLPEGDVLAANFIYKTSNDYGKKIIGKVSKPGSLIYASNKHMPPMIVTHYIDINKFDITE